MENTIFIGKGSKNNEAILKLLYEKGCLTPWKIAKELALLDPKKPKDTYHKAQKIQSVLIRKNGRLDYLVNKEFIKKNEQGFCLTVNKGSCSALVLYGDKPIPKSPMTEFLQIDSLPPELRDFVLILSNMKPEFLKESQKEVQDIAIKLLNQGLNFEKLTNQQFNCYFNAQYEQLQLQRLKTGEKSKGSMEWTPELRDAANKYIARMVSMLRGQVKELQETMEKYAKEQQK